MLHALPLLKLKQFASEHPHGRLPVLYLAALVLALYHDSRGQVCDSYRRGSLIYVLTARAARTICIDSQIVRVYSYLARVIVKNRCYIE